MARFSIPRVVAAALGLLSSVLGCQTILGFEEFTPAEAETPKDAGEKPGAIEGTDAGRTSAGLDGEGDTCGSDEDCADPLSCLFSRCRQACGDETECVSGSLCLFNATGRGGCRVAREARCDDGECGNAQLVCGLDNSCRVDCGPEKSCDSPTQTCIAGSCVSTVGDDAERFDCGAATFRDVVCDGAKLLVCNTLSPGLAEIAECESAAVCKASISADGKYDPRRPPECGAACPAGKRYCEGSVLLECKQDGSGPVDSGATCATPDLCAQALDEEATECPEPACDEAERRCAGGQTTLEGQTCNAGRTAFDAVEICDDSELQCNPGTASCFALKIDATEVSRQEYAAWLATKPAAAGQPPGCAWNDDFAQPAACIESAACNTADAADCPAVCVDWCDAAAYCAAQDKRLCGKIGGGMVALDRYTAPGVSEWMNACSAGGQFVYGQGNTPPETEPTACHFLGNSSGRAYPSGSHRACASPAHNYKQLFDLSGNVAEWENACERAASAAGAGASDVCLARGGSYASPLVELECASVPKATRSRSDVSPDVGFRCCTD